MCLPFDTFVSYLILLFPMKYFCFLFYTFEYFFDTLRRCFTPRTWPVAGQASRRGSTVLRRPWSPSPCLGIAHCSHFCWWPGCWGLTSGCRRASDPAEDDHLLWRGRPPDVAHHLCAGFLHCGSFVGPECVLWAVSCCWGWGRCWLSHISIDANVWGESNIMTDVY